MRGKLAVTLLLSAAIAWPALGAGKRFEGLVEMKSVEKSKTPFGGEQSRETTQTTYYRQGMIKIVEQPDNRVTIIRADKQIVWSIDLNAKTYTEMTFQQAAEMQKRLRERSRQIQSEMAAQLQNLPPEQRQMMEKMMQSQMGKMTKEAMEGKFRLSWKETGETAEILGHLCKKYIGLINDQPILEAWVTDQYDVGEELASLLKAEGLLGGEGESEIQVLHGLPLKTITTVDLGTGFVREESIAVKIQEASIPASEFELPSGLTREAMDEE
jgi:hypothetical protein